MLPFLRMCLQAVPSAHYFLKLVFLCLATSASYLIVSHLLHPVLLVVTSNFVPRYSL